MVRGLNVLLISTYELGRQPFGLASPAAWLRRAGAKVVCQDLAVERLSHDAVVTAGLVAIYVPMHTATRLAIPLVKRVRDLNPTAHICFYGLYAPVNEQFLRELGADTILGGEFEHGLASLAERLTKDAAFSQTAPHAEPVVSLARQHFLVPDRSGLPPLQRYAYLTTNGTRKTVGYTEATRGCKHLCRHCPVVPVYNGRFRVVQRDVVLGDISNQVKAGATHITFGDPDFFNGPKHAVEIVKLLHERFPHVTYDVTIKVEHLLNHAEHLPVLQETGCALITSAVESFDGHILEMFDKRHTADDVVSATSKLRQLGIAFNPTFVAFTPWTTLKGYLEFLTTLLQLDLVPNVSPIQYAIRLLIPEGSKLLELGDVREVLVGDFDKAGLCHRWSHRDQRVDELQQKLTELVVQHQSEGASRAVIFSAVMGMAIDAVYGSALSGEIIANDHRAPASLGPARWPVPYLSEPWYC